MRKGGPVLRDVRCASRAVCRQGTGDEQGAPAPRLGEWVRRLGDGHPMGEEARRAKARPGAGLWLRRKVNGICKVWVAMK